MLSRPVSANSLSSLITPGLSSKDMNLLSRHVLWRTQATWCALRVVPVNTGRRIFRFIDNETLSLFVFSVRV